MEKIGKYILYENQSYGYFTLNLGKQGSYGIVRKVLDPNSGKKYVIKKLKYAIDHQGISPNAMRQISIHSKELDGHKNILKLIQILNLNNCYYMVFQEYQMNLRQYFSTHSLNMKIIKTIMHQLFDGIAFAHSRGIIHRDIKPDNILVRKSSKTQQIQIAIADWGLSRICDNFQKAYTLQVTAIPYKAPELLIGKKYSKGIDIWAMGCILFELLTDHLLFAQQNPKVQLKNIITVVGCPNEADLKNLSEMFEINYFQIENASSGCLKQLLPNVDDSCIDLLKGLLMFDPSKRLVANQALKHDFFKL